MMKCDRAIATSLQFACWLQSRELQITVCWKDCRQMCAVKFLRLEDFLDDRSQGMAVQLEPKGILFAEVRHVFVCVH